MSEKERSKEQINQQQQKTNIKDSQKQQLQLQPTKQKKKKSKRKKKPHKQQLRLQPTSTLPTTKNPVPQKQQLQLQPSVDQQQSNVKVVRVVLGNTKTNGISSGNNKSNTVEVVIPEKKSDSKDVNNKKNVVQQQNDKTNQEDKKLDECNVFIKFLPSDMDDESLYNQFCKFGTITSCKVMIDKNTGNSLGYGFVRYSKPDEAQAAIKAMNGYRIANKTLLCKLSNVTSSTKSLPQSQSETQMKALFGPFGQIPTDVIVNQNIGMSKQMEYGIDSTIQAFSNLDINTQINTIWGDQGSEQSSKDQEGQTLENQTSEQSDIRMIMPDNPYYAPQFSNPWIPPHEIWQYYPLYPPMMHGYVPMQPYHRGKFDDGGANLFVFHLPSNIDDAGLYKLFQPFGLIESVKVITDKQTGESKGYGFVKYYNLSDAVQAITAMNGYQVGKKHLKVSFKTPSVKKKDSNQRTSGVQTKSSSENVEQSKQQEKTEQEKLEKQF